MTNGMALSCTKLKVQMESQSQNSEQYLKSIGQK
jgi:hypothetical protein